MTRVLLTGGSGFIAAHILDCLLRHGHSVVTTLRSEEKVMKIKEVYPDVPSSKLDFVIVEDVGREAAFDQAVISDPPLEAVIHVASPCRFVFTDIKKALVDPAIIGTLGIIKAVKKHAPYVKRIVITSSVAAMFDISKGARPDYTYSEKDWSPITMEEAVKHPAAGYVAGKTFAERAAWEFVEKEKPNFEITTLIPPAVFGPIVHHLHSLSGLNSSNERFADILQGRWKDSIPEMPFGLVWVDVRDVAEAHVKAMEIPEAGGKRIVVTAGHFSDREIVEIVRENFPELASQLPSKDAPGGDYPEGGMFKVDSSLAVNILGLHFRTLEECVVDTIRSLQAVEA